MHDGTKMTVGGKELTFPALNLKALKGLAEKGHLATLSTLTTGVSMSSDQVAAVVATIAASLHRNYPDLDEAWVEENVELADIGPTLTAILSASGFKETTGKNAESP